MSDIPTLGSGIVLSTAIGYKPDDFIAAAKRCFDSCPELHRIIMLWDSPGEDVDGNPFGQSCDIAWILNGDIAINSLSAGISDAFKAAAWDFNEGYGRLPNEFGDKSLRNQVSCLRIGRNLSLWWFDNDDYRRDPQEAAWENGRPAFAAALHPVFLRPPSAHEEISRLATLEADMPKIFEALTTPTESD